jgi:hypothetical protein
MVGVAAPQAPFSAQKQSDFAAVTAAATTNQK